MLEKNGKPILAKLTNFFSPHKFHSESPTLLGLGVDTLGKIVALSVKDSSIVFYKFSFNKELQPVVVDTADYKLDKPFDFSLTEDERFNNITIWQEKIGIVGLIGGKHKVLLSPDGITLLKTYETPMNIIRYWENPFYLNHQLTAAGSKKLKSK